ncbi:LacI family DNA-binding transcriptional regulator [Paracoccaceae bacterium GXU_MW_L88]
MPKRPQKTGGSVPTLRDIAKRAGVSEMTASRVIRDVGYVADSTRKKVLAAAAALGYVPNQLAGALAMGRVNLVGLVIPSMRNVVFPEVLSGLSKTLRAGGFQPVIGVTDYDLDTEEQVIRDMLSWRPSGIVVAGLDHTGATRAMLRAANIPVAEVMDVDGTPIDINVGISHIDAGRAMGQAMVEKGYKTMGFGGGPLERDQRGRQRYEGFCAAVEEAGLAPPRLATYAGRSSLAMGRILLGDLLDKGPLDAVYFGSDLLAAGAVIEAEARGLKVPSDVALAGFNGLDILEGFPRALATTRSPRFDIGVQAAQLLLRAMEGDLPQEERKMVFPVEITPGETI